MGSANQKMKPEVTENKIIDEQDLRKKVIFQKQKSEQQQKKNLLINVQNLSFSIGRLHQQNVPEFKIYAGEQIRLKGLNGKGKSTLLKFVTGAVEDRISLNEVLTGQVNLDSASQYAQYIRGKIEAKNLEKGQFFSLQQVTNYPTGFSVQSFSYQYTDLMIYQILCFLQSLELQKFKPESNLNYLSMGEFIRLQLGVLARVQHELQLLILDEPGNFLDVFTQNALIKLLKEYDGALLFVSHDDNLAEQIEIEREFELT